MGRADDKEGEGLLSEADEEPEKDTSDIDDPDYDSRKKYKCTEPGCTARFLRPSRLTWHLRKHNDERPYKCDQEGCDRAYTNSSHLKRHQHSHIPTPVTKSYECTECSVIVGSLFSLRRHHRKVHDPTRLTCESCGAKFRKKHCYMEHLSMHAGVTLYECGGCDQQFSTQRLLKKHQLIHEKLKSYACKSPGCGEIFNQWSKLVKHVETKHVFDHECSKCGKKFKNKAQLSLHHAVHANKSNPMQCPYENCPRFYTFEKNLDEHIAVIHLGRKFICDTCGQGLTSKASIIRHIKKIHEEPVKPRQPKKGPFRRRRKDVGKNKRSMAVKLAGLQLPNELEKIVMMRKPRIILERVAKSKHLLRKNDEEKSLSPLRKNNEEPSTSSVPDETEIIVEKYLEEFSRPFKQTEEEISLSASNLLDTGKLLIYTNQTEESSNEIEPTNKKMSSLGDEKMHTDSGIMEEKVLEKSPVVGGQTNEGIEILEVEPEPADESNLLENNLQESSETCEKIDTEMSRLTNKMAPDDTEMMVENLLEKSSMILGQIDEEIELLEVELEQTDVMESESQESPESSRKKDKGISFLVDEKVLENLLEKSSPVSRQIDKEIEPLEVELEQKDESSVLKSNLEESAETTEKIVREISLLDEEIVQDDMEMMVENISEKSSVVSVHIDEEIELLEVELERADESDNLEINFQESLEKSGKMKEISLSTEEMVQDDDVKSLGKNFHRFGTNINEEFELLEVELEQADESNIVKDNFQESPASPVSMDRGISFPVEEIVQENTKIVLDNFLEKSPYSLPEVEKELSILMVHRVHTRKDPRRERWYPNIAEKRIEERSNEPEQTDMDLSNLADDRLTNDSRIILDESSNMLGKTSEQISMLAADQMETDGSNCFNDNMQTRCASQPKIIWDLKVVDVESCRKIFQCA